MRRHRMGLNWPPCPSWPLICGVLLVLSQLGMTGCGGEHADDSGRAGRLTTQVAAPDFSLLSLDGDWVSLGDLRGRVVLVDFWATWCGPCRKSIPHLLELYAEYGRDEFEIIGIAVGDREESVRRYVEHQQIVYPICLGDQSVAANYGIQNIPTAYLIDRDGRVAARYVGLQSKQVMEEAVRRLVLGDS